MVKITEITRQALLDHATDVFAENGFDRAPVREITRRASVNQAAINYHFGGKEALYHEVLRLAVAALSDASLLDEKKIDRVPRDEAVRLFIRQQVTPLLKHSQIGRYLRIFAWETLAPTAVYRDFIASEKLPILRLQLPAALRRLRGNHHRDDLAHPSGCSLHPPLRHAVAAADEPQDRPRLHR